MKILIGSTGFVGSNIAACDNFDGLYHRADVKNAYGTHPELLVYAGTYAAKYLANQDEEKDWEAVRQGIENIKAIRPKRVVLVSTIDVLPSPYKVTEDAGIELSNLEAYGKNRRKFELWVMENFTNALIVRLPGLFGHGLKKNFIFDMLHPIPKLLNDMKYEELATCSDKIRQAYVHESDGFWHCIPSMQEDEELLHAYKTIGFTALNFTDSRGTYQFYNLSHLWKHICIGLNERISLLHLATEPIAAQELYQNIYHNDFINELSKPIPCYDFRTKYDCLFHGQNGYLAKKIEVLREIREFIKNEE